MTTSLNTIKAEPQETSAAIQPNTMASVYEDLSCELDRGFHVWLSTVTAGISPVSVSLAYTDWLMHLSLSPGKIFRLWSEAAEKAMSFRPLLLNTGQWGGILGETADKKDKRFKDDAWNQFPFSLYQQIFLSIGDSWQAAVTEIDGVSQHHVNVVAFFNHLCLDALAPSNFIATNPVVLAKIRETFGQSLALGLRNFLDDSQQLFLGELPHHLHPFEVGKDLAISPGKVVYRNRLIELIQYSPTTKKVYAEPILIVPAWIMKYYILDLTPGQSLVEYLVQQGHTVFLISWKNPNAEDHDIGFNDYMKLSVMESLDVINTIVPDRKIHAAGYCIGGILLSIAAAWMSQRNDGRLQTVTLLAAQSDFDRAGDLLLFMDESQLAFLSEIMKQQGYLNKFQLKSIFQIMHANDLIWSYLINNYLLGERTPVSTLMAWSADVTRMPYKMHKEYLEKLYLHDELSEGDYEVDGKTIVLRSIKLPIFSLATEKDYLSPWRSVYKLHLFTNTDITFVLTNGGHNAGIVSELKNPHRHYHIGTTPKDAPYISACHWLKEHQELYPGSWWSAWHQWLIKHSTKQKVAAPTMGSSSYPPLDDAPGTYVHQK
ncbi:MAG: polyhydroxyalkanoate synthase [Cellvibrionaceae bacterium]|jgi:polyhydroxyalkanoate synthase